MKNGKENMEMQERYTLHLAVAVASFCTLRWYPDLVSHTHQLCKNETLIVETAF